MSLGRTNNAGPEEKEHVGDKRQVCFTFSFDAYMLMKEFGEVAFDGRK